MTDATFEFERNAIAEFRVEIETGDQSIEFPCLSERQALDALTEHGLDPLTAEAVMSASFTRWGPDAELRPHTFTDDPTGDTWTVELLRHAAQ